MLTKKQRLQNALDKLDINYEIIKDDLNSLIDNGNISKSLISNDISKFKEKLRQIEQILKIY